MKAVTIGGAMVDAIGIIDDDRIERMSLRNSDSSYLLIEQGRKIEAREISQHCGGGGVNTAVAMARLGFDVATVLKLGQDARADAILRRLSDEGVSTRWVTRDAEAATGSSMMIAAHDRDAAIFTFRGANTLLRPEELKPDMLAADLVYISSLSNEAAECFPALVRMGRAAGARVATNPGIRQLTRRSAAFFEALGGIDILSVNRVEAASLVPQLVDRVGEGGAALGPVDGVAAPDLAQSGFSAGGFEMSLSAFISAIHGLGVGHVLITDGKNGAYASGGGALLYRPAETARVVGTAGAGDAFAATFAAWLTESGSVAEALDAAAINAASVIGYVDTQSGLLRREEIAAWREVATGRAGAMSWSGEAFQRSTR
ncbi:MAG: carbohydrate kinase family protein [Pseudomonadota bacterium]